MTPERWQELKQLVGSALAVPEAEREAFVRARASEDSELRGQALSLLSSVNVAEGFLSAPALEAAGSILDSVVEEHHTPIPAGARFGPYEVVGLIGAGGMGEVYRARDERLKRDVAIKVLPALFSQDRDRLRRFEQEARAAGGLNHPNILAIYDIGSREGAPYVVSELLEGDTLRSRLVSGALPARKAIEYAVQIARGLATAHEKGIVHRDLKPENLFITKDGRVKILDFGLAKVTHPENAAARASAFTTTPAGTEPGIVMGTVGYMSPEQVRGQSADARSDIFSFGAILYEMLSGKRAFQGSSPVETMSAILREDPSELSATNRNVSPGLDRIVRHCLEKSPEERFQSARDIAFDLEALSGTSGASPASISSRRLRIHRGVRALATAAAVVAALAVGHFVWLQKDSPLPSFRRLTFRRGLISGARFVPDGRTIAYSAAWEGAPHEIFTVRTDSTDSRPVGLSRADLLSVSSKGELAVLLRKDNRPETPGTLARIPLAGGTPREILEGVYEADWAPNGEDLAVVRRLPNGKKQLEYPIGTALYLGNDVNDISFPRVSPSGDLVAFSRKEGDSSWTILTIDPIRKQRTVTRGWNGLPGFAWSPKGDALIFTGGRSPDEAAIHAVSLSGRDRILVSNSNDFYVVDVASNGRILAERELVQGSLLCQRPGESRERDLTWLDFSMLRDLSMDGSSVLFAEFMRPRSGAFLRKTDGSPAIRLGDGWGWSLSPDGRWALALTDATPVELVLLPTGPGTMKKVPIGGLDPAIALFLPNGRGFLLITYGKPDKIFVVGPEGGKPQQVHAEGFVQVGRVAISPDGESVAYSEAGGQLRIASLVRDETRSIPAAPLEEGDRLIQWSADGRFLYLVRRINEAPARVDRLELATGRVELWKRLIPEDHTGIVYINPVRITPDGRSYAYTAERAIADDLYVVEGVR